MIAVNKIMIGAEQPHRQQPATRWGFIWRDRPLDFFTPRRQLSAVREWEDLAAAIAAKRDGDAERSQRLIFFNARDAAIATLQKSRGGKIDRAHLIKD